jgi:hypothetical protein
VDDEKPLSAVPGLAVAGVAAQIVAWAIGDDFVEPVLAPWTGTVGPW